MILVQLTGGLGNQLFQYAIGRKLSLLYRTSLKFDLTMYSLDSTPLRSFELSNFDFDIQVANKIEISLFNSSNFFLKFLTQRVLGIKPFHEKSLAFDPAYKDYGNNICLRGYWQTEKYFSDIETNIRSDLKFKYGPSKENQRILEKIQAARNSVSLHIRRGDYVQNPAVFRYHGVCSNEYYQSAVNLVLDRVEEPFFFIFSDDTNWVLNNFKVRSPYLVVNINSPEKSYEDLRLMSTCKHNIIANSSFSWWGAWLNTNSEKIIIAPKRWFSDEQKNIEGLNIVPARWIRL